MPLAIQIMKLVIHSNKEKESHMIGLNNCEEINQKLKWFEKKKLIRWFSS